jgi:hypothetical protein
MNRPAFARLSLLLALLAIGNAAPARAQLGELNWALKGGVALPLFSFGEYFEFGPTVGLDVGYPLRPRVDLKLDLDFDMMNRHEFYATPVMKLWRYRVGVEGDVLGDGGDDVFLLRAHAGVGASTFHSSQFWLESRPTIDGEQISKTYFTGTGGVRVGLRTGVGLIWWLGGQLNWSPVDEENRGLLEQAARNSLSRIGSATSATITLGFNLNR